MVQTLVSDKYALYSLSGDYSHTCPSKRGVHVNDNDPLSVKVSHY